MLIVSSLYSCEMMLQAGLVITTVASQGVSDMASGYVHCTESCYGVATPSGKSWKMSLVLESPGIC